MDGSIVDVITGLRRWALGCQLRIVGASLIAACLALAAPPPALAAGGAHDWADDVATWLKDLPDEAGAAACLEKIRNSGNPFTLTVLGIPATDARLNAAERETLNRRIENAVPPRYQLLTGSGSNTQVTAILPGRGAAANADRAAREFYRSNLFLQAEIDRWHADRVTLRLSARILDPDDGSICANRGMSGGLDLTLPDLQFAEAPAAWRSGEPVLDLFEGLKSLIRDEVIAASDLEGKVPERAGLAVTTEWANPDCVLGRQMTDAVASAANAARKDSSVNGRIGGKVWPVFYPLPPAPQRSGSSPDGQGEDGDQPVLLVTAKLADPGMRLSYGETPGPDPWPISITLSLGTGNNPGFPQHAIAAVPGTWLAGCVGSGADQGDWLTEIKGEAEQVASIHDYRIVPAKAAFEPGRDNLEVDISLDDTLFLYCWMLADDRSGVALFPNPSVAAGAVRPSRRPYRFPERFFPVPLGAEPARLPIIGAGRSLFGCFSSRNDVDPALRRRWLDAARSVSALSTAEVAEFRKAFRADPTVTERYVWIDHLGTRKAASRDE
ncbi:hypothetical protein [Aurantimonas sp. VKM B-3413]|uniref:hypothetical protein n=1 Tax=Aurantimonas sp. VKM B-3413 TaxID=2779401 RepID=UPI001E2CFD4B|nr:hypothetical protein [Aurantimonas sp. VKM B-3413]